MKQKQDDNTVWNEGILERCV